MQRSFVNAARTGMLVLCVAGICASPGSSQTEPHVEYLALAGSKPEYFEDPGQFLSQTIGLTIPISGAELGLEFGATSVAKPVRETQAADSTISLLSPDLLTSEIITTKTVGAFVLPTSPNSQDKRLRGIANVGLQSGLFPQAFLRPKVGLGFTKYLFAYTKNDEGDANRNFELKLAAQLEVVPVRWLAATAGIAQVRRYVYAPRTRDFYESFLGVRLKMNERVSISAQLLTSESLVKNGHKNHVKLYERDITQVTVGLALGLL